MAESVSFCSSLFCFYKVSILGILVLAAYLLLNVKIVGVIIQTKDVRINRNASIVGDNTRLHLVLAQSFYQNSKKINFRTFYKRNMKLLSLNCQSYNTAKKDIYNIVDTYNFDILCLSETWETEKEKVNFKNWTIHSKARKSDNHGGVAVICKPSQNFISQRITEYETEDVEALFIHI